MDLGTIRDKLKNLEYPDVDSFVADVRLVFSNSDKYNLVCNQLLLFSKMKTTGIFGQHGNSNVLAFPQPADKTFPFQTIPEIIALETSAQTS